MPWKTSKDFQFASAAPFTDIIWDLNPSEMKKSQQINGEKILKGGHDVVIFEDTKHSYWFRRH
jgi:hypothetical protein